MSGVLTITMESSYEGEVKQRVVVEEYCADETEQVIKNFALSDAIINGFKSLAEAGGMQTSVATSPSQKEYTR